MRPAGRRLRTALPDPQSGPVIRRSRQEGDSGRHACPLALLTYRCGSEGPGPPAAVKAVSTPRAPCGAERPPTAEVLAPVLHLCHSHLRLKSGLWNSNVKKDSKQNRMGIESRKGTCELYLASHFSASARALAVMSECACSSSRANLVSTLQRSRPISHASMAKSVPAPPLHCRDLVTKDLVHQTMDETDVRDADLRAGRPVCPGSAHELCDTRKLTAQERVCPGHRGSFP